MKTERLILSASNCTPAWSTTPLTSWFSLYSFQSQNQRDGCTSNRSLVGLYRTEVDRNRSSYYIQEKEKNKILTRTKTRLAARLRKTIFFSKQRKNGKQIQWHFSFFFFAATGSRFYSTHPSPHGNPSQGYCHLTLRTTPHFYQTDPCTSTHRQMGPTKG